MAGLYIHIPFCASRCAYCDFYSTASSGRATVFLEALKREMKFRRDFFARRQLSAYNSAPSTFNCQLSTVYVGGGTPSLLKPEQLQSLLDSAAALWDCSALREVTLEANPEDLTDDYISRLADTGFNRLSIGIQSFDDGLLRLMNRRHNARRAKHAVQAAQKAGFDNISIDLIWGIPGMTNAQWERTLDEAVGLGVQHISAYHLTIEPGTLFGNMFESAETHHPGTSRHPSTGGELPFRPVTEEESEKQFAMLRQKLGAAGFEHYEISNFALPTRRAVHNSAYWGGEAYLGIGPSAHSFDGVRRREWVVSDLGKYISDVGSEAIYNGETLSDTDLRNERLMTGLRTAKGIANYELQITNRQTAQKLLADGLLIENKGRIAIPPEKFLLSDMIISELFETPD